MKFSSADTGEPKRPIPGPPPRLRSAAARIGLLAGLLVGFLGVSSLAGIPVASAAEAATTVHEAQTFLTLTNRLRASLGQQPLVAREDLVAMACGWASEIARVGEISHSPQMADRQLLSAQIGTDWSSVGENAGSGPDAGVIHGALVDSPAHYRNLVNAGFVYVGICVRHDTNGSLYVVQEFLTPRPAPKARRARR